MAKKPILMAAVDFSEYSPGIVRYTGLLAEKMGAEVVLINVINQRDLDMVHRYMIGYDTFSFPEYLENQSASREAEMNDLVKANCANNVPCRITVMTGVPYLELLKAIETEKPSLMILGTKGRSNLTDALIGSTAQKMYRRCPIPLLTIPAAFNALA